MAAKTMKLSITEIENPTDVAILKSPAKTVSFPLTEMNKTIIQNMQDRLYQLGGVGLAAPQVNVSQRIIVIYIPDDAVLLRDNAKPYPMHVMINPSYRPCNDCATSYDIEACYSVKAKAGKVQRYNEIELKYQDEKGSWHTSIENGFYARVLQHEIDHLNGILIIDRLKPSDVQGTISEMMNLRRSELSKDKQQMFDKLLRKKNIKTQ
ncbi:peptide deformylase [Cysteiniphilum sp. QT6929]|uniref:peptide deformylase n=1 Tax=Cysteiniphilum sp. QT6929 TaxID=2975055 RepID=UPI0024B384EF|nr:peptide deformylase [Cysteiniphilum sp. QT6929]WHN66399.1 peptide deformylase [Cysteiniphilum sp. QT6929]